MSGVILDSCVVIDLLRGKQAALDWTKAQPGQIHLSVVSIVEIRAGERGTKEAEAFDRLMDAFTIHPVDRHVAELAGAFMRRYARSHGLDIADAFIAATAHHLMLPLATLNLKHFPMFPTLEAPY